MPPMMRMTLPAIQPLFDGRYAILDLVDDALLVIRDTEDEAREALDAWMEVEKQLPWLTRACIQNAGL